MALAAARSRTTIEGSNPSTPNPIYTTCLRMRRRDVAARIAIPIWVNAPSRARVTRICLTRPNLRIRAIQYGSALWLGASRTPVGIDPKVEGQGGGADPGRRPPLRGENPGQGGHHCEADGSADSKHQQVNIHPIVLGLWSGGVVAQAGIQGDQPDYRSVDGKQAK